MFYWVQINSHFSSTSANQFGTSHSRLVHKITSTLPETIKLFVLSDHPLNSESLNVFPIPIFQYAHLELFGKKYSTPDNNMRFKIVQCRIVLLNPITRLNIPPHKKSGTILVESPSCF